MKTIYRSEILNKDFDTVEELETAEAEFSEKKAKELALKEEKKAAAKEVEAAYKEANDAMNKANDKLKEFCSKYGAYHTTYTGTNLPTKTLIDHLFDSFWF